MLSSWPKKHRGEEVAFGNSTAKAFVEISFSPEAAGDGGTSQTPACGRAGRESSTKAHSTYGQSVFSILQVSFSTALTEPALCRAVNSQGDSQ